MSKIYLTQIKKNRIIQIQYDQIETSNNIRKKQKGILEKQIKINEEKMMELMEVKNKLEHISSIDYLTGLNNRRSFDKHFIELWSRAVANSQYFSVIFIDIDFFKQFNDLYGHLEGDKCLKTVAQKISQYTTKEDFSARFGGEEFIIVITNKILEETLLVAEYLRTSIEALKIDLFILLYIKIPHRIGLK